ncbi:hypothetical protein GEU84_018115 [Fertoebacter nigrum]|uniref:Uncharacterized protein n=1 Tax=Fertoeibacter niger TaxID=2656921 RepID=A0A8X8KSC4_9RHOB|nr:hypothetical protein [Fertoeibacter niger]NUB46312.1 hypothetical protein [Fertoeibacter niger]
MSLIFWRKAMKFSIFHRLQSLISSSFQSIPVSLQIFAQHFHATARRIGAITPHLPDDS